MQICKGNTMLIQMSFFFTPVFLDAPQAIYYYLYMLFMLRWYQHHFQKPLDFR